MTAYIIKSSLSLILLFGLYWFLLRKEKLFTFNRFFLVASVVFSLIVPFLSIPITVQTSSRLENILPVYNHITPQIIHEDDLTSVVNFQSSQQKETPLISIPEVLFVLYILGVLTFLIRFLRNLYLVTQRSRLSEKISYNGYKLLLTSENQVPCCFFKSIFLNREDYHNGRIDKDLLDHEMEHARQSHTIDIILIEAIKVFYWFNPIYLLYERAIRVNHEYLADHRVITYNSDIKTYANKLLSFINCSENMSLTSGSHNTFTKMRLNMMMKSQSGSLNYGTRIAITLCLVSVFFVLLSFKVSKNQAPEANSWIEIQQNTVKGIVTTEDGIPLTNATVTTLGSNNESLKSLTFPGGRFMFSNVQSGAYLNVECNGFKTQTIKPDFSAMMTIKMVRDPDYKGAVISAEIQTVNFRNSDFTPANAIVVINGEVLGKNSVLRVVPGDIQSLKLLNTEEAANKYGEKAMDGALEITLFSSNKRVSKNSDSDTSKYKTLLSINRSSNKGELIDLPVSSLQYASVWTYHNLDKKNTKELRTIQIMTRDYYKVRGKISGENEKPLPGVKISATENSSTVTSDKEGNFIMEDVPEDALLEFALTGYKTYYLSTKFEVAFNEPLSIVLKKNGSAGKEDVYETAEKMPQYPGGNMELLRFVAENTRYPENAKKDNAQGRVVIRFIVNTHGNVEDPVVLTSVHPDLDKEALRVVSQLKGFTPGSQDGKPINVYYNLPLTFSLPRINSSK
jgi:TonB family protein